ncbi:MAG: hypothetical protein ACYC11_12705 [Bellilinea sp.]
MGFGANHRVIAGITDAPQPNICEELLKDEARSLAFAYFSIRMSPKRLAYSEFWLAAENAKLAAYFPFTFGLQ